MMDIRASGLGSWEFARQLLEEERVGVVPGAAFGDGGEGFVRVTLAASQEALTEGAARIGAMLRRVSPNTVPSRHGEYRGPS
jgi:aspartate/methionine/tyrosine aminotransferase